MFKKTPSVPEIPALPIKIVEWVYNNKELPIELSNLQVTSDEFACADQCSNLCMSVFMDAVQVAVAKRHGCIVQNRSTAVGHIHLYFETKGGHVIHIDMTSDNITGTQFKATVEG